VPVSLPLALVLVLSLGACGGGSDAAPELAGPLIEAARTGAADEVRSLVARGADVEARDPSGATALVAAAYGNHVEAGRLLIEPAQTSTPRTRPSRARF
jgi:ankyrin repeat protein